MSRAAPSAGLSCYWKAISWQMHLSLVLKAFGPLIIRMSWEWTIGRLFVTCDVFTRYFCVALPWLFRGPHLLGKIVFGRFPWLFRGFFVALILGKFFLRVLALEVSSKTNRNAANSHFELSGWTCWKSCPVPFWKHPKGTRQKGTGILVKFQWNSSKSLVKF